MSEEDRQRWNHKWRVRETPGRASRLLRHNRRLLTGGLSLDLACGRGQNSVWLAAHGYQTLGVDISRVALEGARAAAAAAGLGRCTLFVQADLDCWRPPADTFDLIAVFRFLDRRLFAPLRASVRAGGLIFYETRHLGLVRRISDANPAYLLQPGELLQVFGDWETIAYEEGSENASLVARKPS